MTKPGFPVNALFKTKKQWKVMHMRYVAAMTASAVLLLSNTAFAYQCEPVVKVHQHIKGFSHYSFLEALVEDMYAMEWCYLTQNDIVVFDRIIIVDDKSKLILGVDAIEVTDKAKEIFESENKGKVQMKINTKSILYTGFMTKYFKTQDVKVTVLEIDGRVLISKKDASAEWKRFEGDKHYKVPIITFFSGNRVTTPVNLDEYEPCCKK